jgi:hypothetical protein
MKKCVLALSTLRWAGPSPMAASAQSLFSRSSSGKINQASSMANVRYDVAPGAVITHSGAALPLSDPSTLPGLHVCSTSFAYQGIVGVSTTAPGGRLDLDVATTARPTPANTPTTDFPVLWALLTSFGQPDLGPAQAPPRPRLRPPRPFMSFFDWDRYSDSRRGPCRPAAGRLRVPPPARQRPRRCYQAIRLGRPGNYKHGASLRRPPTRSRIAVRRRVCRRPRPYGHSQASPRRGRPWRKQPLVKTATAWRAAKPARRGVVQ